MNHRDPRRQSPHRPAGRCLAGVVARLLAGVAVLLVAACGGEDEDRRIELRWGLWGTPEAVQNQRRFARDFMRLHPNVRVEIEPVAGDVTVAFSMRLAGGDAPDVLYAGNWFLFEFADKGTLLPLDDLIARDGIDMGQFFDSALSGIQWDGATYALPEAINVEMLFYNQDIFDRYGVPYPEPGWTWDDYLEKARRLTQDTDGDGRTDIWGCYVWTWIPGFLPFMLQNESNMFDDDFRRFTMDDPRAIEALQFIQDLIFRYRVAPGRQALQSQLSIDMFASGRIAMGSFGYWGVRELQGAPFRWDVAELPRRRTTGNVVHVHSFAINRETEHPEEAWELIKYLTLDEPAREVVYLIPAQKRIAAEMIRAGNEGMPANAEAILATATDPNTVSPPFGPRFGEYSSVLGLELDGVWLGKVSVEEAVRRAKPQIELILSE